ncbi:MAG: DUF87 domain-containing protein [Minisyncoccia bacterium]
MGLITIIILLAVLVVIFIAGLVTLGGMRTKGQVQRALNMTLFLVKVPRETGDEESGGKKSAKELINITEQMISSFSNLHAKGWNKFIFGEPYLALEIAVHHIGEETHFYVSVPRTSEDAIEKQLYAFFPKAEISTVKDYNIFNPDGVVSGSYLKYSNNPILPIRTYQNLEADPLSSILTSMSKLQAEGEGAALQLLIRPSHAKKQKKLAAKVVREMQSGHQFKDAVGRVKHPPKLPKPDPKKPVLPEKPKTVSPADEEIIKAISAKVGKQIFDVNIRLLTSAPSEIRAKEILDDFENSFVQYSAPDLNNLKAAKQFNGALNKLIYNFSFRIFNNKQKMVMSTEEIASIYHFPLSSTSAPNVQFLKAKPSESPANMPQVGIILGKSVFRGQEKLIRMTDDDRRRHLYLIGQTGTGKTTLMKDMVRQDIEAGNGVCVIDPHGDFAEFALSVVPRERAEEVIYFDPADTERPLGLNLLEIDPSKPEQKTFITNEFYSIMKTIYRDLPEAFGPMFENYYKNAALLLLDDYENEIPTLADISRVLADDNYRKDKLSREKNYLVKNFWEMEAEKAGGEAALANMVPYITSKMAPFLANEFIRPIVTQQKSAFNFRDIIDNRKILVVNLSKGKIGDINANLLGLTIVSRLLMAAFSRSDTPGQNQLPDFYLYMDEFQNFSTPSIATILSEARKYKLDLIMAHQFIKQLPEEIKNAVFGNVGSMAVFRVSPEDAEYLKTKFEPTFTPQDLSNIDNLNAYVNLLISGQTARPFNIRVETDKVFGAGSKEMSTAIKELSRMKFGRPREEVEKELMARYNK